MKELNKKYKDKGVKFIGISLDTQEAKNAWIKAVKRIDVPWDQLSDLQGTDSELAKSFAVSDVPYTVVVDEHGIIIDCLRFPIRTLEPFLENLP